MPRSADNRRMRHLPFRVIPVALAAGLLAAQGTGSVRRGRSLRRQPSTSCACRTVAFSPRSRRDATASSISSTSRERRRQAIFSTCRLAMAAGRFQDRSESTARREAPLPIGTIRGAQIAAGPDGRVHVAWNGSDAALPRGVANPKTGRAGSPMLYARSNAQRTAFEPQRNLMKHTFDLDGGGSLAVDEDGAVYVAWHANDVAGEAGEAARRVWLARSTDGGAAFAPEARRGPSRPARAAAAACGCSRPARAICVCCIARRRSRSIATSSRCRRPIAAGRSAARACTSGISTPAR